MSFEFERSMAMHDALHRQARECVDSHNLPQIQFNTLTSTDAIPALQNPVMQSAPSVRQGALVHAGSD